MAFKIIRTGDENLDRVQQNVQAAFQELAASAAGAVVTTSGPQYRATGAELVVFVDARGGPVTVVLPDRAKGILTLRSVADTANAIKVVTPGASIDGDATARTLGSLQTLRLAFDGRAWWSV